MAVPGAFVRYDDGVESEGPEERIFLEQIVASQTSISERLGERYWLAVRSVHTKGHGILSTQYLHEQNVRPKREPRDASEFFVGDTETGATV